MIIIIGEYYDKGKNKQDWYVSSVIMQKCINMGKLFVPKVMLSSDDGHSSLSIFRTTRRCAGVCCEQ